MTFAKWYAEQFRETLNEPLVESDGIAESSIDALIGGRPIPEAMRAYYRVAGNHWMNTSHNRLHKPDAFERVDDHTIFMEENQCVVQWAIREEDMSGEDPPVYMGQCDDSGQYEWFDLDLPFSRFIIEEWRETLTGEWEDSS